MITLFCDLDNTLIYSHRRKLGASKRVAEILHGKEQSYITAKAFDFLSSCQEVSTVAVTTRTMTQYDRVQELLNHIHSEYALVLNGAVLLRNGIQDESWLADSIRKVKNAAAEMNKAKRLLEHYADKPVRYSDSFLTYIDVGDPPKLIELLEEEIDAKVINVFSDSRKVYCAPTAINKGTAVAKFKEQFETGLTVGVGDSLNDISMLEHVDVPILPQSLSCYISNPHMIVVPESQVLSDAACDEISNLIKYSSDFR